MRDEIPKKGPCPHTMKCPLFAKQKCPGDVPIWINEDLCLENAIRGGGGGEKVRTVG